MKVYTIAESVTEKFNSHKDYYKACEELKLTIIRDCEIKSKQDKKLYGLLPEKISYTKDYYKVYLALLNIKEMLTKVDNKLGGM